MSAPQAIRLLKQDAFGRVELVAGPGGALVRRVASGGGFPGARWIARVLLQRERRALAALAGLAGVAQLASLEPCAPPGRGARREMTLLRSWIPGCPLSAAEELPRDYFERLEELVRAVHERGVCHNDLHKEGNVLVGDDGYPGLVDFQLASVHARRGRAFAVRAREDLRHVWKHRSVYLSALGQDDPLHGVAPRRSCLAEVWRRAGKPLYNRIAGIARHAARGAQPAHGEVRRPKYGPWPRWIPPVGPRPVALTGAGSSSAVPPRAR